MKRTFHASISVNGTIIPQTRERQTSGSGSETTTTEMAKLKYIIIIFGRIIKNNLKEMLKTG